MATSAELLKPGPGMCRRRAREAVRGPQAQSSPRVLGSGKLVHDKPLRDVMQGRLKLCWSMEQVVVHQSQGLVAAVRGSPVPPLRCIVLGHCE
jgi:hypothetical protein